MDHNSAAFLFLISPVSACMFVGGLVEAIKHSIKEEKGLTTKYELISALGLLLLFGMLCGAIS